MRIKTCSFVDASDLFMGCPDAWQEFMDSDPPVSWGDAHRTLVSPDFMDSVVSDIFSDDYQIAEQLNNVLRRVRSLKYETYIDLEN
jgi:hypothetical protein